MVDSKRLLEQREQMVRHQLSARGVTDQRVLQAFRSVPRHEFVPTEWRDHACADRPLPIGAGQTISQPLVVALTLQHAQIAPDNRVLDVGCGSGYQAALLSAMGARVFAIEMNVELAERAQELLNRLGYRQIEVVVGDGWLGLPAGAPYDKILVGAAAVHVPIPLERQLAAPGRMLIPLGTHEQTLWQIDKSPQGEISRRPICPVRFVPLVRASDLDPSR